MNKIDNEAYKHCLYTAKTNSHINFYNYLFNTKIISAKKNYDKSLSLQEFLIKTVIGQQISISAAESIWKKVRIVINKKQLNENNLAACGVSKMKQRYIMGIHFFLNNNPFDKKELQKLDEDELNTIFLPLKGIGPWSIKIMQIFFLENTDVWLPEDLAIKRGLNLFFQDEDANHIQNLYSPYRTYFCLYLWSSLN